MNLDKDIKRLVDHWISKMAAENAYYRHMDRFKKYPDADQHLNQIDLFDFDHPGHPGNCEINDGTDLIPGPHEGAINVIVNGNTRGPSISWHAKILREGVVYLFAIVIAIESFMAEFVFQFDPDTNLWRHLQKEDEAFQKIARDLKTLHKLAQ